MNLITGGNGFIGRRLIRSMLAESLPVVSLSRRSAGEGIDWVEGDLTQTVEALLPAFSGIQTVFHCAGHAHAFKSSSSTEADLHWKINFEGTRNVLAAAGRAGVKSVVFLSSVKAMADPGDSCASEDWPGAPDSDYGRAKRAAEEAALEAGQIFGMRVTNLRLAMVYGSGGRGNLERMARLIQRGWFPPLPETGNRRSLVHVDDVVGAMRFVAAHPKAGGETYIVAGAESPSGRQLYDAIRSALGLPPVNWAVPAIAMRVAALSGDLIGAMTSRRMPLDSEVLSRLLGSACYSPAKIQRDLGWRAKVGLTEGLRELVRQ